MLLLLLLEGRHADGRRRALLASRFAEASKRSLASAQKKYRTFSQKQTHIHIPTYTSTGKHIATIPRNLTHCQARTARRKMVKHVMYECARV